MKKIIVLAGVLCSVSSIALAETLPEVLSFTYENNPTIMAARAGLRATDESVSIAKSGYRPNVKAEGSVGRSHNKLKYDTSLYSNSLNQTPVDVSVSFVQPVFSGLSTYQSVRAAKSQVKYGEASLFDTEQNVLLDAIAAYMDVIRDEAVLNLRKSNEKVLKKHLESYKKRYHVGELTRTDISQSEARVSGAHADVIAAEGDVKVSRAKYLDIIGQEPLHLQDVNITDASLPSSLDEALTLALSDNPQIQAADYAKDAAKYDVKSNMGTLAPSVDVRGAAGHQKNSQLVDSADYWQVTANLTVPLYQSGSEYAKVRQAKQIENQQRILLEKIRSAVKADTTSAWEQYQSTKAQIASIQDQIKASKTALDGVIREADVGQRTVLDVLDAEQEHLNNQVKLVQVHREEVIAAYGLMMAIGQLSPTGLNLSVAQYNPADYDGQNRWFGTSID